MSHVVACWRRSSSASHAASRSAQSGDCFFNRCLHRGEARAHLGDFLLLRRRINPRLRFVGVVEEGEQAVILGLRDGIELVRVALRALEGQTERAFADDIHAVEHRLHAELFRDDRAFLVDHAVAEETGGDELGLRAVGQEVARDLLDQELVVRQVAVQGLNHPVAPGPLLAGRSFS